MYANCYGIAIAVGIITFAYFVNQDPRRANILSSDQLNSLILWGTLIGILGARLLWVTSNWPMPFHEIFELWEGGFAVLGSIIGILLFLPFYLKKHQIPVFPLLDLAAIYTPLLQSIARVGCFLAGCCYGMPTNLDWGVIYTHPDVAVPMELRYIPIHPTQLYSAILLFVIFLLIHNIFSKYFTKPGQLITVYLMLSSTERFLVDFWRADQEFFDAKYLQILSFHQWIALAIFTSAALLFIRQTKN